MPRPDTHTDPDDTTPVLDQLEQLREAVSHRFSGGIAWSIGIAVLGAAAGVVTGNLLWASVPDVITRTVTVQDPAEVTIVRIYEDGSGTFGTGRRTLSDGQVITLDDQVFCLQNYGCAD